MTEVMDIDVSFEQHRRELIGYCYRMLGSASEAEDATQETLLRAWRGFDGFEGRSSVRSWLYRIGTNVCLDMLKSSQRRARPMDIGPSAHAPNGPGEMLHETAWIQPIPDERVLSSGADPADVAVERETIRLAFVAALQHLPPRQRAVLILRDVLRWRADEVAELIDTTVVAVNSALERARAALAQRNATLDHEPAAMSADEHDLVARYADAFQRYDIDALVSLLHDDATMNMPPYALWLRGPDEIARWHLGPGAKCRDSKLAPTRANGQPAFGQYRINGDRHLPFSLQVLEISGDRISGLSAFLDVAPLFDLFGLAPEM